MQEVSFQTDLTGEKKEVRGGRTKAYRSWSVYIKPKAPYFKLFHTLVIIAKSTSAKMSPSDEKVTITW